MDRSVITPTVHREVERKLRVPSDFVVPDLVSEGIVASITPVASFDMAAVYHDTPSLSLFRWRATLRRREGGTDAGWHLKLPVAGAPSTSRDEIRLPLLAGTVGSVPAALVDIVSPLIRGERLIPQVTVRTNRTPQVLHAGDGAPFLELVDDSVVVLDAQDQVMTTFREIEVELLDHEHPLAEALLETVIARLIHGGATVESTSKAASALGATATEPPDVPSIAWPPLHAASSDALRAALSKHVRHFILSDVAVRRGLPDSVHQMRVAARRIRSILKSFSSLLDESWAASLAEELAWIASELGAIRDTEVLLERLDRHADQLGCDDGPYARSVIDPRLEQRLASSRSGALGALRSDRHEWLLDDLVAAATAPVVGYRASVSCGQALPPLIDRAWRALEASVTRLTLYGASDPWHRARIKAKRARYAVEAVAPTFGKQAMRFADVLAELTEALGEHQDAVVAQQMIRELSDGPGIEPRRVFALGRLHAYEADREIEARRAVFTSWSTVVWEAGRSGLVRHAGQ